MVYIAISVFEYRILLTKLSFNFFLEILFEAQMIFWVLRLPIVPQFLFNVNPESVICRGTSLDIIKILLDLQIFVHVVEDKYET